jgi:hypothetical protein
VHVIKNWLVNCTNPSNHNITGSGTVVPDFPLHVSEPDPDPHAGVNNNADTVAITVIQDKDITAMSAQQEPDHVDVDGVALVEDRLLADPNDPNGDSGDVAVVLVDDSVAYEFFARVATLAVTNTSAYNLTVTPSATAGCAVGGGGAFPEAPEAAGTVNVIKGGVSATLNAAFNTCTLTIDVLLASSVLHVSDIDVDVATDSVLLCRDRDDDGVADPDASSEDPLCGPPDNCPDDPNPGQEDSDDDGIGDVCDDTPFHDDLVKYCLKFGPAPVNLSDNFGSYLWVLCEIGNDSGHDDLVTINPEFIANLPGDCTAELQLIIPGQTTFILLEDEQKFVLYRVRIECHSPLVDSVVPVTVRLTIDHIDTGDGEDLNQANDSDEITQNVIISTVMP